MKASDILQGRHGQIQLISLSRDAAHLQAFQAEAVARDGTVGALVFVLAPGVTPEDRRQFQEQINCVLTLDERLAEAGLAGGYAVVLEAVQEPIPFIAVEPPSVPPLYEQIVTAGPLPEIEGLRLAHRLFDLLAILHDDLDAALSPAVFAELRWQGESEKLWWPVWLGLDLSPADGRKVRDLALAGELLHLALLGQMPVRLWGESLALPAQHGRWSNLSYGARHLLRGLLHPQPERRPQSATAALAAVRFLLDAWEEEHPKARLADVEAMLEEAKGGISELAERGFFLLDVLGRRGEDLGWLFDALLEDAQGLRTREKEVTGALNLLRGGSREAALAQIDQAASEERGSLRLWRWHAMAADDTVSSQWLHDEFVAVLREVGEALEVDAVQAAQAAISALEPVPQALASELGVRVAWQSAVEASEMAESVTLLDEAGRQLAAITDAGFRRALDFELGGVSAWRARAAAHNLADERLRQQALLYEQVRAAREDGDWKRASAFFEVAATRAPLRDAIGEEGKALGLACMQAQESFVARRVFARALSEQGSAADDLLLGWRTAQAQALLSNSPSAQVAIEVTQTAVAALIAARANQRQDDFAVALMGVLEMAVVSALRRVRATQTPASQAAASQLAQEWSRLNASMHLTVEEQEIFQELETTLHRAWAQNPTATQGSLAKWLGQLGLNWPSAGSAEAPGPSSTDVGQDLEAMRKLAVGLAQKARSALGTNAGAKSGQAGVSHGLTNEQIAAGLVSSHFDEVAKALDDWDKMPSTEREKMAPMAAAAQTSLQNHKAAMLRVTDLAEQGQREAAYKALRMGTRHGESRMAWDPHKRTWTATKEWLALLESNGLDRFRFDLAGPDPFFWARTIQSYVQNRPQWPPELLELAQSRWKELDRHRQTMEQIFSIMKKQPAEALEKLEAEVGNTPDIHCWNPERRAWVTAQALRGEIETRLALPEIRNRN